MSNRPSILKRIEQVMGTPPSSDRSALDVEVVETVRRGGSRFQKIRFTPEHGDRAWAWLGMHERLTRPAAGVVCLHQTTKPTSIGKDEPVGFDGEPNLHYAAELTARGLVTITPDYPNFGEYEVDCYTMGYASAMRKSILNHMRAIDLLQTLPQVDSARIGCIGHSRGGHGALFLAAFDPRVRVAVSSCGFTRFVDDPTFHFWGRPANMPRVATVYQNDPARLPFDFPDVLKAIAPRALFVNAPRSDVMSFSGVRACLREVAHTGMLDAVHPDCGHDFPADVRRQAYAFMDRVFAISSTHPGIATQSAAERDGNSAARQSIAT